MRFPRSSLPTGFIRPTEPALVGVAPDGDQWLHEIKYDGFRTQVRVADGSARAFTRNGHDWTERYGQNVARASTLRCRSAIFDSGMIVQDEQRHYDNAAFCKALHQAPERLVVYVLDLLQLDGEDLRTDLCSSDGSD